MAYALLEHVVELVYIGKTEISSDLYKVRRWVHLMHMDMLMVS